MCIGWADEWSPVICWVHDWVGLSERQSWSQRNFISGFSTSSGLAVEWILFPSVPEPEMSCLTRGRTGNFIWHSHFLLVFPISFPYSCPILISPLQPWVQNTVSSTVILPAAKQGKGNRSVIACTWWIWTSPYMPSLWKSKSVLAVEHLGLQMLLCSRELQGRLKSCECF